MTYRDALAKSADLVVIGGGVVGAATAFHACRAGLRVLLIESRPRLCTLTTPASTGAFRLQFDGREELELVRRSVELFLNFADVTRQKDYDLDIRQHGYLFVTANEEGRSRQRRLVSAQHEWGQTDVELLNGDEARYRFPYLTDRAISARFRAGDGFLDPKQLTMGLAMASGADIVTACPVTGFRLSNSRLTGIETIQGTVSTERVVIAAGPFSGVVAGWAGIELPVTTVVRQKVILPHAPEVPPDAPMTIDDDTGAHWRPALRGAYVLFTDPTTPSSPPADDVPVDHRFAFSVLNPASPVSVARVSPFWKGMWERGSANWILQAGQYTMTPDHRPLIGPTPIDGLFVNTGYSGHGIMGSPAGSALLIEVLTGKIPHADNPFRPDRAFEPRELDIL